MVLQQHKLNGIAGKQLAPALKAREDGLIYEREKKKVDLSPEKNEQIKQYNKSKEAKFLILRQT